MPQSHGVHNEVYIMGDNAAQLLALTPTLSVFPMFPRQYDRV